MFRNPIRDGLFGGVRPWPASWAASPLFLCGCGFAAWCRVLGLLWFGGACIALATDTDAPSLYSGPRQVDSDLPPDSDIVCVDTAGQTGDLEKVESVPKVFLAADCLEGLGRFFGRIGEFALACQDADELLFVET